MLTVSAALALGSMLLIPPDAGYAEYVDWNVIMLLFSLMAVVGALKNCGVFDVISTALMRCGGDLRRLSLLLTLACFFVSMVVTNDVALITFVPLTVGMLSGAGAGSLIYVVTLETIAANLGSMATPIGNPQNLYLYSRYSMSGAEFAEAVMPIAGLSLALLLAACLPICRKKLAIPAAHTAKLSSTRLLACIGLLALCILSVFRVLPRYICCIAVAAVLLLMERRAR